MVALTESANVTELQHRKVAVLCKTSSKIELMGIFFVVFVVVSSIYIAMNTIYWTNVRDSQE